MRRRAEVLAVGDELLSGARVNGNAAWLGAQLAQVGVTVVHGTVVGDDVGAIVAALRTAAARVDVVVVTGGLGPTTDDRTREALAVAMDAPLVRDDSARARIESWYAERGREPSEAVLHQADLPAGAVPLVNDVGTAPGVRAEVNGALVFCLPGVPVEMTAIMTSAVLPELREAAEGGVAVAELRTVLLPETLVATTIEPVAARAAAEGIDVAYLPSVAEVVVRFVAAGRDGGDALVRELADQAAVLLGDAVAVRGSGTLADEVVRLARDRGVTLAVAESLTGGLVAAALTSVPGASAVFRGGVVAYATELKRDLLGVPGELLDLVGPIDPAVAAAMAAGARTRLDADFAVAATGVAGPDPQAGHAPGAVHLAVDGPGGRTAAAPELLGDRDRIRAATVTHALELLRRALVAAP